VASLEDSSSVYFSVPVICERDGKRKAYCGCSPQVFDALQKLMPELQVDLEILSARWKALASIVKRVEG
jgi:hypothetical protein